KERSGIKHLRVPLGQEGQTPIVQRVPQRNLPAPKALAVMMCQRITKEAKVAKEKCSPAQYHLRVSGENTGSQDQRESARCEPFEALGLVLRFPKRVRIRVFQLRHRDRSPQLPGAG